VRVLIALALISVSLPAHAQQFVPFTVDEQSYRDLRTWIDEQPTKFGLPLLNWIDRQEQKALVAEAEKKKAAAEAKKAAPEEAPK
jgi:hypothetical protein